ncbi:hypothetical protein NDU88_000174 [Pleurodeles waltl]|uniref:Uncharacterized protein n=1 Tax=Pleurodeles waltl TaxID=8319 RepID=A0AAV7VW33_PLEWA|nr:hypothetical protein NDU88_000174 [Pleurodeles waltl]
MRCYAHRHRSPCTFKLALQSTGQARSNLQRRRHCNIELRQPTPEQVWRSSDLFLSLRRAEASVHQLSPDMRYTFSDFLFFGLLHTRIVERVKLHLHVGRHTPGCFGGHLAELENIQVEVSGGHLELHRAY